MQSPQNYILKYLTNKKEHDMRTRKIYLTSQEKPVIVRHYQRREMGLRTLNWHWFPFFCGFLVALALPFLIDWALFGTPTPCHTEKVYNNGSSLQSCEVRR